MAGEVKKEFVCRKRTKWSTAEEFSLIGCVLENENTLFGLIKGAGDRLVHNNHKTRAECWQSIAAFLNAKFTTEKRTSEEVKKKYFNIKQRAQEKIELQRRTRTAQHDSASSEDAAILATLQDRRTSLDAITSIQTDDGLAVISLVDLMAEPRSSTSVHPTSLTTSAPPTPTSTTSANINGSSPIQNNCYKHESLHDSDMAHDNMRLYSERLQLEKRKLDLQIQVLEEAKEKISMEKHLLKLKTVYYQAKLERDFGTSVVR